MAVSAGQNSEIWDEDFDSFLADRGMPFGDAMRVGEIEDEDLDLQSHQGLSRMIVSREGATFARLAHDVFLIPVIGGQFLHHDRHLESIPNDENGGFSEHTWNLVAEGSDDQMLILEVGQKIFEHFSLERGAFIYMNTMNLHMISRKSPHDVVVIVQVEGFDRTQRDEAMARLAEVLSQRPRAANL